MDLRVRRLLSTVSTLTTLPLILATASYGQICASDSLRQAIEQLQNPPKRPEAQKTLTQCGEASVKPLANALGEPKATIRLYAAQTLGQIGWEAKSIVPALVATSQDDRDPQVRRNAVLALSAIAQASQTQSAQWQGWQVGEIQTLKDLKQQLDTLLPALEKDPQAWSTKDEDLATLRLSRNRLQTQINSFTAQPTYQVISWAHSNPWIAAAGLLGLLLVSGYGGIFLLRPIWLLKLGDGQIKAIAQIPKVGTILSGLLQGLSPLKYHPRVLDTWVEQHWQQAKTAFLDLPTVKDRHIHITLPVRLGQEQTFINELSGSHLKPTFQKRPAVLLIVGEGGAGKTSLACQIAQWGLEKQLAAHRLLPILLETELDDKKTLTEAIRGQLTALINETDDIPIELLEKLLQRQRILVIVDHFSEMGEATRKQITPDLATFPAKALVLTSRLEKEALGGVPRTILKPLRIEADRLLGFMQAYVRWRLNKPDDPFVDDEYAAACDRLRRMVNHRDITVLLARLYAEQMIEQQQGAGGVLPASVPDLMLSYVNQLNSSIEPANQRDRLQVRREAQVIAWECLKQTYRPTAALREDVIQALRAVQPTEDPTAQACSESLDYLEKRLRLVQTLEPGDKIRLVLDPLAEYLAAHCLVEQSRTQANPDAFWQDFLDDIEPILKQSHDPLPAIQGFLRAVRDCGEVKQKEARISAPMLAELTRKAGFDPEELRLAQEKRRIRIQIAALSEPVEEDRIEAARKLGQLGTAARVAAPNLIGMLENPNQTLKARQAAAETLGKLGIGNEALLQRLTDPSEELAIRRSAAEALGRMKAERAALLQILHENDQPLPLRQGAARALSLIGAPSGEPVPILIVELQGEQVSTPQVKSIPIWREVLTESLTLDLVDIPGGEFLMGSPPREEARDWYKYTYPELEGVDVEAQHRVTIQAFSMSQTPITQAQWRFVASLPRVDQDLEPDPANFKGDDRPVEVVSWHEAVEFCDRLSNYTGKTYRLPSEAEWEYACRGGTTTPFHIGETLFTDIANYDGNYTYGNGVKGEFRQKTTEVGSFGIVNAFGLSDMHGNVFEWCLDHWHPSYEGAPADGSAWVTEGDDRYRVVRGGSLMDDPVFCRSALRFRGTPTYRNNIIGFRVVSVLA